MSEMLVIVESPAKAKTIGKFLGSKYKVVASNGHVRDLPKSQLGVDVDHDFEPKYITLRGRGDVLENIRREAKAAMLEQCPGLCRVYSEDDGKFEVLSLSDCVASFCTMTGEPRIVRF